MDDLTSTTGIVALAAAAVALIAFVVSIVLAVRLRRLRAAQSALLGEAGTTDLVSHAAELEREFRLLQETTRETVDRLAQRLAFPEQRPDRATAYPRLVRHAAHNQMSGHQSTASG